MSLMSTRKQEPIVVKHRERFQLSKHSVLWDLLDPKSNTPNTHRHVSEPDVQCRELTYRLGSPE